MTYQEMLSQDKYAQAALSVVLNGRRLQQPDLLDCTYHLFNLDAERFKTKGKYMTPDHLKQEAVKWARAKA